MSQIMNIQSQPGSLTGNPILHLDGAFLRASLESMNENCKKLGGVELIIEGLQGKSLLFQRTFSSDAALMSSTEFFDACSFMPTVRRRIQPILKAKGFDYLRDAIAGLLDDVSLETHDSKLAELTNALTLEGKTRWIRDFAAEVLHYQEPETYPLMTRWVWDLEANSGVLREIWFSDNPDVKLDIPSDIRTFLELRRELNDFLEDSGVYANHHFVQDILFAWIYSQYIGAQGGSFLKSDFNQSGTPFGYALRMLGLDTALSGKGLTHLILADGARHRLSEMFDATVH